MIGEGQTLHQLSRGTAWRSTALWVTRTPRSAISPNPVKTNVANNLSVHCITIEYHGPVSAVSQISLSVARWPKVWALAVPTFRWARQRQQSKHRSAKASCRSGHFTWLQRRWSIEGGPGFFPIACLLIRSEPSVAPTWAAGRAREKVALYGRSKSANQVFGCQIRFDWQASSCVDLRDAVPVAEDRRAELLLSAKCMKRRRADGCSQARVARQLCQVT